MCWRLLRDLRFNRATFGKRPISETVFIRPFLFAPIDDRGFFKEASHRPVEKPVFGEICENALIKWRFESAGADVDNQGFKEIPVNPVCRPTVPNSTPASSSGTSSKTPRALPTSSSTPLTNYGTRCYRACAASGRTQAKSFRSSVAPGSTLKQTLPPKFRCRLILKRWYQVRKAGCQFAEDPLLECGIVNEDRADLAARFECRSANGLEGSSPERSRNCPCSSRRDPVTLWRRNWKGVC